MPNKLIDTYLGSSELKKLLIARSTELEIPFKYICYELKIDYKLFMVSYINSNASNFEISEQKFEQVMEMLGVSTRFQFVISKDYTASELRERLKEKYRDAG